MNPALLDPRLQAAYDLFPQCAYGADIGSDHGKLALALVLGNRCSRIAVTDISPVSLEKAEKLFAQFRLLTRADFLLGDGLSVLQTRPEAVSICGMGGRTLIGILERGFDRIDGAALILSPQTELSRVRQFLYNSLSYHLTDERCLRCGGRHYVVMRAEPGKAVLSPAEAELGPVLMRQRTAPVRAYYAWRSGVLSVCRDEGLKEAKKWYDDALRQMPEDGSLSEK